MEKLSATDALVAIIGGGGREHALGLRLKLDKVQKLFFIPGNAGTGNIGQNVELNINDFDSIYEFVKTSGVNLIIVGPEAPLAEGIVDYFLARNVKIIGPTKRAAQLESSKYFARMLMRGTGIKQPGFTLCCDRKDAERAIYVFGLPAVLKVDGLAAGKGAFVCHQADEVEAALQAIYVDKKFGDTKILVENCVTGQEMSAFALCDIDNYRIIGTAQDYKRLRDNDEGPNTDGMGSIAPSPLATSEVMEKVERKIIKPILEAMKGINAPFTGFLYCGLMIRDGEPYVIEFNARLGDPGTQVILPLIKGDFFNLLWRAANNELNSAKFSFLDNYHTALVVKVAEGYPDNYRKGDVIKGLVGWADTIIHAGTKITDQGQVVTNGGRVVGTLGLGRSLDSALKYAYHWLDQIHFKGEFYRRDIGGKYLQ